MSADTEPRWHWRNCRDLSLAIYIIVWPWLIRAGREEDVYGGWRAIGIGPIAVRVEYGIGNCSSESRIESFIGLSEIEAYERACRYDGIAP